MIAFFATFWGRAIAIAVAAIGVVGMFALDQRTIGAQGVVVKMERTNAKRIKAGRTAAAGTTDDRVRGVRDPHTRDD